MNALSAKFHFPEDRYYDRSHHMWAQMKAETGLVTIGVDSLELESIGDLVYVALPAVGASIARGAPMGTLEAAKLTGDFYAPVSGRVVAVNEAVSQDPYVINTDCYGKGWLLIVAPDDWEKESLEMAYGADLPAWVEAEIQRYQTQGWIEVENSQPRDADAK